ncbi:MAG: alpha/beta hydrolase [Proteobacteria bacterium]|nr:alpha/beta hydrolase [Pseudomonadota bacterium]
MVEGPTNNLPNPEFIQGKKNSRIALYRYANFSRLYPPVILTHGTFSNALICKNLAIFLNKAGFDCWIYEWTGHGLGEYGQLYLDAEGFALHDVPAVIHTVLAKTQSRTCSWVAHSGGGFLPLIYMARNPLLQEKIQAIAGMGSQTIGAGKTIIGKLITRMVPVVNTLLGKVPGPFAGLGPEDEASGFLTQWSQWNHSGKWVGTDGFDYHKAMGKIQIPAFFIAGAKDRIAPPEGCHALVNSLGSMEKSFVLCSKKNGYQEDYTHPRLIASQNAKKEIWPMILEFIRSVK